jgi:RNA polymerase sigma-70 factor, ECF subfamily
MNSLNSTTSEREPSADLFALAREGNTDALSALYHAHARGLFALAYRLTRSREEAEDIVHDIFLGLPEALRKYEERGSADAWLKRITARLALTSLRSMKRFPEVDIQHLPDAGASPDEQMSIEGTPLERAIAALPESLRRVFVLKEVEGFSHAEIGTLLDISSSASQVRFHRAVKLLRRDLSSRSEVR